jgi:hypothetical protein
MKPLYLSEDIVPIKDLETQAPRVLKQLRDSHRPVVITQNGRPPLSRSGGRSMGEGDAMPPAATDSGYQRLVNFDFFVGACLRRNSARESFGLRGFPFGLRRHVSRPTSSPLYN